MAASNVVGFQVSYYDLEGFSCESAKIGLKLLNHSVCVCMCVCMCVCARVCNILSLTSVAF